MSRPRSQERRNNASRWDDEIRRRLRHARLEPTHEAEIVRELAQHLDDRFAELRARDVDDDEAVRRTLAELDEHDFMTRELSRSTPLQTSMPVLGDTRHESLLSGFWHDLRYGMRALRATPGFTIVATITLSLAIGATTAMFSIVDAMLVQPLSADPDGRVVRVHRVQVTPGPESLETRTIRYAPGLTTIRQWQQQRSALFEAIGSWRSDDLTLLDSDPVERVRAMSVMPDLLRVFDTRHAAVGRMLTDGDLDQPVALISYDAWQRRYGGDPGVVGRSLRTLEGSRVIVGVLPQRFPFQPRTDFWLPLTITPRMAEDGAGGNVLARLRPGVTPKQAHEAMASERLQVPSRRGRGLVEASVEVLSLHEQTVRYSKQMLYFLFAGVCFVLLIGCANVAGLLIARGRDRQREVAIRASLGAGRWRLIRQFLTENLLLATIGGIAALALATMLMTTFVSILPVLVPSEVQPALNLRVLLICTLVTLSASMLCGLWPAIALSRSDLSSSARQYGLSVLSGSVRTGRLLVVAEIALAMVLLVGAGLMVRSLQRMMAISSGFDVPHALVVDVFPVLATTDENAAARADAFYQTILERLSSLPGVIAVGATNHLPYWSYGATAARIDGEGVALQVGASDILPGYFASMGIPLRAGRDLSTADRSGAPCVAIVNERFVQQANLRDGPLGRRLTGTFRKAPCEIVGVVGDVKRSSLEDEVVGQVYYSARQGGDTQLSVVVRTENPSSLAAAVRARLTNLPERTLIERIAPFDDLLDRVTETRRNRATLFSVLGGLGILLACVGIFGLTAYAVSKRTREIGLRVALGATPRLVLRTVMRDFVPAIVSGLVLGLLGAWAAARALEQFLFGVTKYDPATLIAVSTLLLSLGVVASYLPARRALRVDPVVALRAE